jgi:hypothetical protein
LKHLQLDVDAAVSTSNQIVVDNAQRVHCGSAAGGLPTLTSVPSHSLICLQHGSGFLPQ